MGPAKNPKYQNFLPWCRAQIMNPNPVAQKLWPWERKQTNKQTRTRGPNMKHHRGTDAWLVQIA